MIEQQKKKKRAKVFNFCFYRNSAKRTVINLDIGFIQRIMKSGKKYDLYLKNKAQVLYV